LKSEAIYKEISNVLTWLEYLVFLQVEDAEGSFNHNKTVLHLQMRVIFTFAGCHESE